jgi:alpha-galactosidase
MEATMDFLEEVKESVPGIILENCASGGHRLEPGFMAATSMASFSDAHECVEIPIIAANLHRAILPRQSQIWAVIRETDSLKRIAYSVANTFLGRMCISGDVTNLTPEQWKVIEDGIAFYQKIAPIIKKGRTWHLTPQIEKIRHPEGWQGIARLGENGEAMVLLHTFGGELPDTLELDLPFETAGVIAGVYSDSDVDVTLEGNHLSCKTVDNWKAVAVLIK